MKLKIQNFYKCSKVNMIYDAVMALQEFEELKQNEHQLLADCTKLNSRNMAMAIIFYLFSFRFHGWYLQPS